MSEAIQEIPIQPQAIDSFALGKISKRNAGEYAKIGNRVRWAAYKARKLALQLALESPELVAAQPPQPPQVASEDPRRKVTLEQIDALDKDFDKASPELRIKITASKARLWELLFPKPGSYRPSRQGKGKDRQGYAKPMVDDTTTGSVQD